MKLDGFKQSSFLAAVIIYPAQVIRRSTVDLDEYQLWDFVRMKGAQLFLERRLSILDGLEKDNDFARCFDFFFPAIDRVNSRNEVRARRELFLN